MTLTNSVQEAKFVIPLPPIEEQRRIVTKLDELMAFCDQVEVGQTEREKSRDTLVAAANYHLNHEEGPKDFQGYSAFYISHLPRLTESLDHLRILRTTLISLAVRGQLEPQNAKDEPASRLLERIKIEKAELGVGVESKKNRLPTKPCATFSLPSTWCWAALGDLSIDFRYGTSTKCSYEPTGVPVLRIPNVIGGRIDLTDIKYGSLNEKEIKDLSLQLGDLLIVRSNGSLNLVGRPALVGRSAVGFCYAGYLVRVRPSTKNIDGHYLLLALGSAHVRDQIEIPIRTAVGLKNVNATELSSLLVPVPPLAEQHRIVAKVDALMALCEELDRRLSDGRRLSTKLLESVLYDSLNR